MSHKDLLSCGLYLHSAKNDPVLTLTTLPARASKKKKSYQVCWLVHEGNWERTRSVKHCTEWHVCKLRIQKKLTLFFFSQRNPHL